MGKGYRVDGKKLQQLIKDAGYDTDSDVELQSFCNTAKCSLTALKRWMNNGGIHEDKLRTLCLALSVQWRALLLIQEKFEVGFRKEGDATPDEIKELVQWILAQEGVEYAVFVRKRPIASVLIEIELFATSICEILIPALTNGLLPRFVTALYLPAELVDFAIHLYINPFARRHATDHRAYVPHDAPREVKWFFVAAMNITYYDFWNRTPYDVPTSPFISPVFAMQDDGGVIMFPNPRATAIHANDEDEGMSSV